MLATVGPALSAQSPDAVSRGDQVRLKTNPIPALAVPSRTVVGAFDQVRNDTIFLSVIRDGDTVTEHHPTRSLLSVERTVGQRHPYVKSAIFGTALGTGVGYMLFKINARRNKLVPGECFQFGCNAPTEQKGSTNVATPVGAAVGLIGGLVIGARIVSPVWGLVPMASLR